MPGIYLETLNWQAAEPLLQSDKIIVIPVGAQTKQHGPHLPLNTDWLTAQYLTKAIVKSCDVIALPTIAYGYYPAFVEYPGSVSLTESTFRETVLQIIQGMIRYGSEKFYILNTGISTIPALTAIQSTLESQNIAIDFTDPTTIIEALENEIAEQPYGSHADELETSMMLYMHPELVDMSKSIAELNPRSGRGGFTRNTQADTGIISPSGSWGDPTKASAAKGERLVRALLAGIEAELHLLAET